MKKTLEIVLLDQLFQVIFYCCKVIVADFLGCTKLLDTKNKVDELSLNNNEKFAIRIEHYHYLTKDKDKATSLVKIDKSADAAVKIIRELKDSNQTHKYTAKPCIEKIRKILSSNSIILFYRNAPTKFNSFHFNNICKYYNIKSNERFCYIHKQFTTLQYTYSQQAIDFIVEELAKDPNNILDNIKNPHQKMWVAEIDKE